MNINIKHYSAIITGLPSQYSIYTGVRRINQAGASSSPGKISIHIRASLYKAAYTAACMIHERVACINTRKHARIVHRLLYRYLRASPHGCSFTRCRLRAKRDKSSSRAINNSWKCGRARSIVASRKRAHVCLYGVGATKMTVHF